MNFDELNKWLQEEKDFYPFTSEIVTKDIIAYDLIYYKNNKPSQHESIHITVDRKTRNIININFKGKEYTSAQEIMNAL